MPHITSSPNYCPLQSAYRQLHSTETAVVKIVDDLLAAMDRGHAVTVVCLDMSSALDGVCHQRQSGLVIFISRCCDSSGALCLVMLHRAERHLCRHWISPGLLQLSVLRHVKHELPEVTESAECCCTNCLPSSTTPTSLSRAS